MPDVPAGEVFLHTGLMKTGTSYLQVRLRSALDELEQQGVTLVPPKQFDAHRLAVVVLDAFDPEVAKARDAGALERLPRQLEKATVGRVLISAETLSDATAEQIARLAGALGDRRVHVVLTVRDIGRSLPSLWQQAVRAGQTVGFLEYLDGIVAGPRGGHVFWRAHEVLAVLERWGALAPPERCHVVAVPPAGAPREQLLERFCSVLGVDARLLPPPPELAVNQVNESLGLVQTEVLRRVNGLLPEESLRVDVRRRTIRKPFTFGVLAAQPGTPIRVPHRYADWCRDHTSRVLTQLERSGHQVVGSPSDLMPADDSFADSDPEVDPEEVAESAVQALAALLGQRVEEFVEAKAARRRQAEK